LKTLKTVAPQRFQACIFFINRRNIVNEWYLRDQSRKVATAYKVKGNAGKPVTNNAIYGYKKNPENKDHWIVDDEATAVVRRIFRLAVEGHGPYDISRMLTEEKVQCPAYYFAVRGIGPRKNITDMSRPYDWYGHTVSTIIAKPEYMGHTHHPLRGRWYPSRWSGSCAPHETSTGRFSRRGPSIPLRGIDGAVGGAASRRVLRCRKNVVPLPGTTPPTAPRGGTRDEGRR